MKKDRLVAGGLAGAIGAFVQSVYGTITKAIGITDRTFYDFAAIIVAFKEYPGVLGFIVGIIAHLIVGVMLGIIFAYIIMLTSNRYLYIKGLVYGAVTWFLLLGFGTIYKMPMFKDIPPTAALSTFVGSLIYGTVTAYTLKLLEKRTNLL